MEKLTGLSRGTISRAFNNSSEISPASREAILKKASEIGYSPNSGAGSAKVGRLRKWGLLLPHLQNPWFCELADALDQQALAKHSLLMTGLTHYNPAVEKRYLQLWTRGEVDAVIATSTDTEDNHQAYLHAQARFFPVVFIYPPVKRCFDFVDSEDYGSNKTALQYLYDMGHRRIAYLTHQFPHFRMTFAFHAYTSFHQDHGLSIKEEYIHAGAFDRVAADAWNKWSSMKQRPTAVLCSGDGIACRLMTEVTTKGLRVPQDLSIVGHDDIEMASRMNLTTIRLDSRAFAVELAALLERPRGEDHAKMDMRVVSTSFVVRQSVAKLNR